MMQMTRACCRRCAHEFDLVALPLVAADAIKGMTRPCPMCGNASRNTLAPPRDLTAAEQADKARAVSLTASLAGDWSQAADAATASPEAAPMPCSTLSKPSWDAARRSRPPARSSCT
jgi:hypothetical protein